MEDPQFCSHRKVYSIINDHYSTIVVAFLLFYLVAVIALNSSKWLKETHLSDMFRLSCLVSSHDQFTVFRAIGILEKKYTSDL